MANLSEDISINPIQMDKTVSEQPGIYSYYSQKLVDAETALKTKKLSRDVFESALDKQIRTKAIAEHRKLTEKQIEHEFRRNDAWINNEREIISLEATVGQYKAIVESLKQKKDMLITLSANMRQEMISNGGFIGANKAVLQANQDK